MDVETSFVAVLTEGLTAQGGAAWNTSKQTNSPYLIANNPALLASPAGKAEFGQPIYSVDNPYGPAGGPSANSPPLQFNARLRYQWTMSAYDSFVQAGATHTAHSFTQSSVNPTLSSGCECEHDVAAVREPPDLAVRCIRRRREGCLDGGCLCAKSDQCDQEHVHLDQSVRARGNHHAAAGDRGADRVINSEGDPGPRVTASPVPPQGGA